MKSVKDSLQEVKTGRSPSGGILKMLTFLTMVGGLLILSLAAAALAKGFGSAWTPGALVAVGVFVLLFSCFGFWGAMAKNRGVLCCFAIVVGFMTFIEFIAAISCFALSGKVKAFIDDLYANNREEYNKVFGDQDPSYCQAKAEENLALLGGFALFLVFLQLANIILAVLYRKALRDGEYEKWRSQL
eukprot:EC124684.1.p1 GENE.EC124684.1~~EC124684.1.p1  ORF type:complete len:187 (+),score=30.26 EC124684.1:18-578(+)